MKTTKQKYNTLIADINSQVATVNNLNTQYNQAVTAANAWTEANGTSQAPRGEYARLSAAFNSSMDALEAEVITQNSLADQWTETNIRITGRLIVSAKLEMRLYVTSNI